MISRDNKKDDYKSDSRDNKKNDRNDEYKEYNDTMTTTMMTNIDMNTLMI